MAIEVDTSRIEATLHMVIARRGKEFFIWRLFEPIRWVGRISQIMSDLASAIRDDEDGFDQDSPVLRINESLVTIIEESIRAISALDSGCDPREMVLAEYRSAKSKHGDRTLDSESNDDRARYMAVAEEVGEIARAMTYDREHAGELVHEIVQLMGLALAWLALRVGDYLNDPPALDLWVVVTADGAPARLSQNHVMVYTEEETPRRVMRNLNNYTRAEGCRLVRYVPAEFVVEE